jgi:hypothetical protein
MTFYLLTRRLTVHKVLKFREIEEALKALSATYIAPIPTAK